MFRFTDQSWIGIAGTITAVATLITAVGATFVAAYKALREGRVTSEKIDKVEKAVNGHAPGGLSLSELLEEANKKQTSISKEIDALAKLIVANSETNKEQFGLINTMMEQHRDWHREEDNLRQSRTRRPKSQG